MTRTVKVYNIPRCIAAKTKLRDCHEIAEQIGIPPQHLADVLICDAAPYPALLAWLGLREIEGMPGVYEEVEG